MWHGFIIVHVVLLQGSSTPEEHANYVWKHFISETRATKIDIVAHSYGGVVTTALVCTDLSSQICFKLPVTILVGLE